MVALENSLDTSELKKTIKTRLQEDKVQDELSELFVYYLQQTSRLCTLATVESNGVRPRGLENEIYSCFHHVARGLACVSFGEEVIAQIRTGRLTHLKRAHLDACKITINSYLSQYTKTIETLNNLVVIEDFKSFTLSGVEKIKQILDCSTQIKQNYLNAKSFEAIGDFGNAIDRFETAILLCMEMRTHIQEFFDDSIYMAALSRAAFFEKQREKKEKKAIRRTILLSLISAVIGAVIPPICQFIFGKFTK